MVAIAECQDLVIQETKKIISDIIEMSKNSMNNLYSLEFTMRKALKDLENDIPSETTITVHTVFKPNVPSLDINMIKAYFDQTFISEESKFSYSSPEEAVKRLAMSINYLFRLIPILLALSQSRVIMNT